MPPIAEESLNLNSTTHIHEIYIKADAGAIWDALTKPELTRRYWQTGPLDERTLGSRRELDWQRRDR